jgi:hypothetical protein
MIKQIKLDEGNKQKASEILILFTTAYKGERKPNIEKHIIPQCQSSDAAITAISTPFSSISIAIYL